MLVIAGNRVSGKTTTLIEWFNEHPQHKLILVCNNVHREYIVNMGVPSNSVYTAGYYQSLLGADDRELGVDNLEMFVADSVGAEIVRTQGWKISAVTIQATEVVDLNTEFKEDLRKAMDGVRERLDE